MRIAPIVSIAPFLGAKTAPVIVRIGFALALSLVLLPFGMMHAEKIVGFSPAFIGYTVKEILIGLILGYLISIPFFIVESSGILIDFLRGSSSLMAQDPTTQVQSSPIGILNNYIMIVLFFQIGGPYIFLKGVQTSFELFPIGGTVSQAVFGLNTPFWQLCIGILNKIMTLALQIASPALVAILMAEVFLGIANRLAPQVQIAFLGMSIKSLLGLFLLWGAWFFILQQITKFNFKWLSLLDKIMYGLHQLSIFGK